MKYLLAGFLSGITLLSQAQGGDNGQRGNNMQRGDNMQWGGNTQQSKNPLLNQSFWKNKPDVSAIKAEIEKGNSPIEMNVMNFDATVMAINNNAPTESIIYLLQQPGIDPNKITHEGRTYLIWAANKGNAEVMEYLISKGAKAGVKDENNMSALNFAAANGVQNLKVYDLCIQAGDNLKTDLNNDGANALLLAAGSDSTTKVVDYFQSKGLDLKSKDSASLTAFDYAAKSGNITLLKMLNEKGVSYSPDIMLLTAQGSRRGGGTLAAYQYLESIGIKPNVTAKTGDNPLHYVARRAGQSAIIKYFISKGVNASAVNNDGNTPFMVAAGNSRDTATAAALLPAAKDINQKNKNTGATALAMAVQSNSPEVVEHLIDKGADVKAIDAKNNTLVSYLYESYNARQAKDFEPKLIILKKAGLDVTVNPADGNTLYHLAVSKNDLNLLKRMQAYGGDINAKNKEGLTPLHKAAMMSKDDAILQYLLSIGADKEVKTSFDETAYELAEENEVLAKGKTSLDFLK